MPEYQKDLHAKKADIPQLLALLERTPPERRWVIQSQLVFAYVDSDDYPKALEAYKACRDSIPEEERTELVIAVCDALENYGEMDEAVALLMKRAKELEGPGAPKSQELARIRLRHAQVLFRRGRLDEAMELCQHALAIFTEVQITTRDTVNVITTMGMIMWEKGEYEMALKLLEQALDKAEEIHDEERISNANNSLGLVHYQLGNYVQALKHFGAARVHAKDNVSLLLFIENNTGLVHHDMGDYSIAENYYKKCLQISDERENFVAMALAHCNLGLLAIDRGRPDEARDLMEESLSLCRHMRERWIQALNRIGLARAYIMKGNLKLARHNAEQALQLAEDMKAKESRGMALRELGRIDELEEKKDDARNNLERSLAVFEAMHNRYEIAKSLISIGSFQVGSGGDITNGRKALERALDIAKEIGAKGMQAAAQDALNKVPV